MKLNRRSFIKSTSLITGGFLFQGNRTLENLIANYGGIREIKDNFGVFSEKGGTIGWYVDKDTIIVIDSQFPDSAKNFLSELRRKTERKINFLFNTHHHSDHTLGNYFLKDYSENIISHSNCPRLQFKQNKGTENEYKIVTANITFNDKLNLDLPNEKVSAIHFGQAHTGGDIVIHFENANIAHLGDLVFNNVYPYIDNNGECSVENWINVLNKVHAHFGAETSFIFGHANDEKFVVGNKQDLIRMRDYLESLYSYVSKSISKGKSIAEIAETNTVPGFDSLTQKWEGARKMNLQATAEQLSK